MILGAQPDRTFAVLAGVETYEGNEGWELNGPAMNAMRMALWLICRGVPGNQIQLYVNFSSAPRLQSPQGTVTRDALRSAMAEYGVLMGIPTRATLERALDPAHLPAAAGVDATLIVYISGHGLHSEANNQRYALTADASRLSCDAIDIDNQANNLRLNPLAARFKTQWIIHDACAQTTTAKLQAKALVWPLPMERGGRRQYCLFSAQPSEYALTDADNGGVFTHRLLAALDASSTLADLDIEVLYRQLEAHFRATAQHPALYRRNEHLAPSSLAPGIARSDAEAVAALAATLRGVLIAPAMIRAAFSDVVRERAPAWVGALASEVAPSQDVHDVVADLDARLIEDGPGLTPVELFALQLASYCTRYTAAGQKEYAEAQRRLDQWIGAWPAVRAPIQLKVEQDRLTKIATAAATARVIVLEPGSASTGNGDAALDDVRPARAWLYEGAVQSRVQWFDSPVGSLEERIAEMLEELANDGWIIGTTTVELVLPLDALFQNFSGIDVTLDRRRAIDVPLGSRNLMLALRSSERYADFVWKQQWLDRWNAGADSRKGLAQLALVGVHQDPGPEKWCWLGTSALAQAATRKQLRLALYYGAPFAAWWDPAHEQAAAAALTSHSYANVREVLQRVALLNSSERPFTCFIDDPGRTPFDLPLRQPY